MDVFALERDGWLETYQSYQATRIFECDFVVIYIGEGTLDTRFFGVYRIVGDAQTTPLGLPPEVVAARSGVATSIVRDYRDIFFDVADCYGAHDWLAIHVFDCEEERVSELHTVVCRAAYQGGQAVCEHWLASVPYLNDQCDLTTLHGRQMKRLQLTLLLSRLKRQDPDRLCEVALRVGDLSPQQPSSFVDLSEVLVWRTAQQLGKLLARDEDSLQPVPIQKEALAQKKDAKKSA